MAFLDCTVWPSDATYVKNALSHFGSIISVSPKQNAGFLYLPVETTSTNQATVMKHRRIIEDTLSSMCMDVLKVVSVNFSKPGSANTDKRSLVQHALFVTSKMEQGENIWTSCNVWNQQSVGPIPLIKVSDMVGYDAESKPSPSARVEQQLSKLVNMET